MQKETRLLFLQILLITQTLGLLIYTVIAIQNDGMNFLQRALEFATSLSWMGQFTMDFSCYLLLSGLWVMWRDRFSVSSILWGLLAMVLGIIVFAPYLLVLLAREKGNLRLALVGDR